MGVQTAVVCRQGEPQRGLSVDLAGGDRLLLLFGLLRLFLYLLGLFLGLFLRLLVIHGLLGLGLLLRLVVGLCLRLFLSLLLGLVRRRGGGIVVIVVVAAAHQGQTGRAHTGAPARLQHRAAGDLPAPQTRPIVALAHSRIPS